MLKDFLIFVLPFSIFLHLTAFKTEANAEVLINGQSFITRLQYKALLKPCACPDDFMINGRRCGKASALCRARGKNILDCSVRRVSSAAEYRNIQTKLCGKSNF